MPTAIAFLGNASSFQVFVLESGHGLPSVCNDETLWPGGEFDINNPFTPDILVFNQNGTKIRGPLGKPTSSGGGFQPSGPAIDIAFVNGLSGGTLFATDSNQSTHQHNGNDNSSRISTVNPMTGVVTPFITNLPTGDHPTEQLAFKGGWIYWSQGSTTNSGVVGLDNGSGQNQSDIPCQDITLSKNVFISNLGPPEVATSGYSPFGVQQPGATIPAFFNSFTGQVRQGVCDGAILRAQLSNPSNIHSCGTGNSNPSPSSGESRANLSFEPGTTRLIHYHADTMGGCFLPIPATFSFAARSETGSPRRSCDRRIGPISANRSTKFPHGHPALAMMEGAGWLRQHAPRDLLSTSCRFRLAHAPFMSQVCCKEFAGAARNAQESANLFLPQALGVGDRPVVPGR
jgi:hypothetical protein